MSSLKTIQTLYLTENFTSMENLYNKFREQHEWRKLLMVATGSNIIYMTSWNQNLSLSDFKRSIESASNSIWDLIQTGSGPITIYAYKWCHKKRFLAKRILSRSMINMLQKVGKDVSFEILTDYIKMADVDLK